MSESQMSLVVSGKRQYIQSKLEAIADELGLEAADLLRPPADDGDWISLKGLSDAERAAAVHVVRGFKPKT